MQGLADGYFVLPVTIGDYLATQFGKKVRSESRGVRGAPSATPASAWRSCVDAKGTRSVDSYHKELGTIMWDYCGMARTAEGLKKALGLIRDLREQYWRDVRVPGTNEEPNQALEKAGRVADFFELGRADVHRRPAP